MKTLLYNPIFINPQAYYVFPNLNGRRTPQTETTLERANYIGSIEVKVIAYGEVGKTANFSNTNYIDLELFINSWVRISLYTRAGNVVLGEWKIGNAEIEEPPYIDPDVLESLCGIWMADQNTNLSSTRNIIKNKLSDRGGDFEIINAAYKDNSGYGLYQFDWSKWSIDTNEVHGIKVTKEYNKVTYQGVLGKGTNLYNRSTRGITKFKIKLSNANCSVQVLYKTGDSTNAYITVYQKTGVLEHNIEVPASEIINITMANFSTDSITIEQIPEYQGAFVTDGVDDIIMSQKFISDMTNGSNELTVISMMHQLSFSNGANNMAHTNIVRENNTLFVRNDVLQINETGIYGYASTGTAKRSIKNILGDKNNYLGGAIPETDPSIIASNFSVCTVLPNIYPSSVAWYWTFIAKRELTDDEINQVIAYYNLDKYITPDVYYNVKRQGLTNDNHAQFGDKLIDYSGNGRDMQLYNIGWEGISGINSYPVILGKDKTWKEASTKQGVFTHNSIHITEQNNSQAILFTYIINGGVYIEENNKEIPAFNVRVTGITDKYTLYYRYIKENGEVNSGYSIKTDGVYTFPKSHLLGNTTGTSVWIGFHVAKNNPDITNPSDIFIEILPEYEGALVTDGVEDYGKVEGLPIYKDYTVIAERAWVARPFNNGSLVSKSPSVNNGAFIIEQSFNADSGNLATYSFGTAGGAPANNVNEKSIVAQSKYKYISDKSYDLVAGSGIDVDSMTLATVREKDPRFSKLALWTLLSFPYSLSEFLIERQLKKRKLGTLYPDMIEFRPIVKSNIPYSYITFHTEDWSRRIYPGEYITKGSTIKANLYLNNDLQELSKATCNGVNMGVSHSVSVSNAYNLSMNLIDETPQNIDFIIAEFIRFEDIVQPYPAVFTFSSWYDDALTFGSKLRVGNPIKVSTIVNTCKDIYNIEGYKYNGKELNYKELMSKLFIVEKDGLVFETIVTYLLGNNKPKVFLSPERLKLSNETYKLLGYIPDLSGNGNHGVLNNFAYAGMSGANGYPTNFDEWKKYGFVSSTYNTFTLKTEPTDNWLVFNTSGAVMPKFSVNITGIPDDGRLVYTCNAVTTFMVNGVNTIPATTLTHTSGFYINRIGDGKWKNLVIELLPDYEGSICFDGVEDFLSLPTIGDGDNNKQVLMNLERFNNSTLLYDQNGRLRIAAVDKDSFGNECFAYNGRGEVITYIDGILNTTKLSFNLKNIKHSFIVTSPTVNGSQSPVIGKSVFDASYSNMALYTFVLFEDTDDEGTIVKLNEVIGIEEITDTKTEDFTSYTLDSRLTADITPTKIHLTHIEGDGPNYIYIRRNTNEPFYPIKVKVTGAIDEINVAYVYSLNVLQRIALDLYNGENIIPSTIREGYEPIGFSFTSYTPIDCDITIEIVPIIVPDFTEWKVVNDAVVEVNPTSLHITNTKKQNMIIEINSQDLFFPQHKVRVTGVSKEKAIGYHYSKMDETWTTYWMEADGEYTLSDSIHSPSQLYTGYRSNFIGDCNILVEQIDN